MSGASVCVSVVWRFSSFNQVCIDIKERSRHPRSVERESLFVDLGDCNGIPVCHEIPVCHDIVPRRISIQKPHRSE